MDAGSHFGIAAMSHLAAALGSLTREVAGLKQIRAEKTREEDGATDEKGLKVKLWRLPKGEAGSHVPSSKTWSHWVNMRLRPWAAAQADGFEEVISATLRSLAPPTELMKRFSKVNRLLGFEMAAMVEESVSSYFREIDTSNGLVMILTFARIIHKSS